MCRGLDQSLEMKQMKWNWLIDRGKIKLKLVYITGIQYNNKNSNVYNNKKQTELIIYAWSLHLGVLNNSEGVRNKEDVWGGAEYR